MRISVTAVSGRPRPPLLVTPLKPATVHHTGQAIHPPLTGQSQIGRDGQDKHFHQYSISTQDAVYKSNQPEKDKIDRTHHRPGEEDHNIEVYCTSG